jgi:hypothetical protein
MPSKLKSNSKSNKTNKRQLEPGAARNFARNARNVESVQLTNAQRKQRLKRRNKEARKNMSVGWSFR